jgi:hypothetical protein
MMYVIIDEHKKPLYNTVFGTLGVAAEVLEVIRAGDNSKHIFHNDSRYARSRHGRDNTNSNKYQIREYNKSGIYE